MRSITESHTSVSWTTVDKVVCKTDLSAENGIVLYKFDRFLAYLSTKC